MKVPKVAKNKVKQRRKQMALVMSALTTLLVFSYTNCAKQFSAFQIGNEEIFDYASFDLPSTTLYLGKKASLNQLPPSAHLFSNAASVEVKDTNEYSLAGVETDECMTNPEFDACLVWKNPAARRGYPWASWFQIGTDLSGMQKFGVKLKNRRSPASLKSNSIAVSYIDDSTNPSSDITSSGNYLSLDAAGKLKVPYAEESTQDETRFAMAQISTYFWLTHLEIEMKKRTRVEDSELAAFTPMKDGVFPASYTNRPLQVHAFFQNSAFPDAYRNAYFVPDPNREYILLGWAGKTRDSYFHELGINAEVGIHEYGHANFHFARNRKPIHNGSVRSRGVHICESLFGCMDGIDEGMADFHAMMIFPDSPSIGDTFVPGKSLRDVRKLSGKDVKILYKTMSTPTRNGLNTGDDVVYGEIHNMGLIYSSILWDVYNHPQLDKRAFEATFMLHLQALSNSANFFTARNKLISFDQQFFQGRNSAIIEETFHSRGL